LITGHELHTGHLDYWMLALYTLFLLFLWNRARRLKSRIAELVDLAAYRAGLQRIARTKANADKVEDAP